MSDCGAHLERGDSRAGPGAVRRPPIRNACRCRFGATRVLSFPLTSTSVAEEAEHSHGRSFITPGCEKARPRAILQLIQRVVHGLIARGPRIGGPTNKPPEQVRERGWGTDTRNDEARQRAGRFRQEAARSAVGRRGDVGCRPPLPACRPSSRCLGILLRMQAGVQRGVSKHSLHLGVRFWSRIRSSGARFTLADPGQRSREDGNTPGSAAEGVTLRAAREVQRGARLPPSDGHHALGNYLRRLTGGEEDV